MVMIDTRSEKRRVSDWSWVGKGWTESSGDFPGYCESHYSQTAMLAWSFHLWEIPQESGLRLRPQASARDGFVCPRVSLDGLTDGSKSSLMDG